MPYAGPSDAAASTVTETRLAHSHRRTRSATNFSDERGPGAFAGLGQLPRLNKRAVFHINDNDDDNANDDDRPSYPTAFTSPYSPLNSLRLSMNTGKFSPSVEPPPRIDIPRLASPSAIPFPTSSPTSPSPRSPPSFSLSSRSSSKTNSPSLPRTPSTPIILSNGKPLKPSLKSSSSSPNISDLPTKHLRAQSAPSTPSLSKNVHFAEKDSGLETIRVFNRTGKPASLSKPPGEETETETEAENGSFPFPAFPTSPITSSVPATLLHEIDPTIERTSMVPKVNPSPYANVLLETLALPRTRPPTLRGTVLVRNVSFEKVVAVRFTLDEWQTTSEVMGKHVVSLPGLPPPFPRARTMGDVAGSIATGQPIEEEQKESAGPAWDRFSFTIRLEDYEAKLAERTLFLVVRYNPGSGGEWWDNNGGANYRVGFRRVAPSPLPSPAIGVTHSQQRTFSAPSTLKTTPTTGSLGSPYAPPTRQLAPAPPQLTRTSSYPLPTVPFSSVEREQKERDKMSEKGLGSPTAAYLSRKLSLSNYVAPSAQPCTSSIVTPPTTPPDTVRLRSATLPPEAGHSAEEREEQPKQTVGDEKMTSPIGLSPTYRSMPVPKHPSPTSLEQSSVPSSSALWSGPSSPSASSPPALSPILSIPGPSANALASQSRSFGMSSYPFGFVGGRGYQRPQLLSPPRSKESSPASSGTASPRREGSPEPTGKSTLGVGSEDTPRSPPAERAHDSDNGQAASVASLSTAVRDLGLNISPSNTVNSNTRVDTSDPTYAALLKQWCFAQSSPPAPTVNSSSPTARSTGVAPARGGEPTSKVDFGTSGGYSFPGFNFGLPDAGMVGAHMR